MPLFKHHRGKEPASTRTELRPDLTQPNTAPPPGSGSPVQPAEVVRVRAKAEAEAAQPAEVNVKVMAQPLPRTPQVRCSAAVHTQVVVEMHSRVSVLRAITQASEGKGAVDPYDALEV